MTEGEFSEDGAKADDRTTVNRRTAMIAAGSAAAIIFAGGGLTLYKHRSSAPAQGGAAAGYGVDPDLKNPKAPWPLIMSEAELKTAAVLCDLILPASGDAPSATEVGVPAFINEWVSAPYPDQLTDRKVILGGFAWLNATAHRRFGAPAYDLPAAHQTTLFDEMSAKPRLEPLIGSYVYARLLTKPGMSRLMPAVSLYRRLRTLTVGAYFSTDAGFKDIGYIGNQALDAYPAPSPEVIAALDRELAKLGLKA